MQFLHHYQKNRYRIYRVEITKLRPYRVTTRWGRKTPKHRKPRWTGIKEKEFESIQAALNATPQSLTKKLKEDIISLRPQLYEQALSGETCKTTWVKSIVIT